jgi:regulatory protein
MVDPNRLRKIQQYCAYQERTHQEVREKLYALGASTDEVNEAMAQLIEEDFLNEERFAITFAGGKFRINHWGKTKIRLELRRRHLSDYCIRKALEEIPDDDYREALLGLLRKKAAEIRPETHPAQRREKLVAFALQKGYEAELARELVRILDTVS